MAVGAIDDLTAEFARLPGVGRKTASRLTFFLLKRSPDDARRLARALDAVAERVRRCTRCGNLTEADPCDLCADPRRDHSVVCVVEEAADVMAIERTGQYKGAYHVLGGRLSPLDGVGPEDLNIDSMVRRIRDGSGTHVRELIIATNPSVEGEATALYLQKLARPQGIRVTRLARGLPVGGDLEYADGVTIAEALSGRREL
jgi:recombination protein RecR